jgi:hypothetical protein
MQRIKADEVEQLASHLMSRLAAYPEWFCTSADDKSKPDSARRDEYEFYAAHGQLFFSHPTAQGTRTVWRVSAYQLSAPEEKERITLAVERRAGRERATLELIPRASVSDDKQAAAIARLRACEFLAKTASEMFDARIERAGLSRGAVRSEPGRYARILLRRGKSELLAVTCDVADADSVRADAMIASAIIWFFRLTAKSKLRLYLVGTPKVAHALAEICALLRSNLRSQLSVYETNDDFSILSPVSIPTTEELFTSGRKPRAIHPLAPNTSELSRAIINLAPDAIDVVRSRHGETLRFHGLAFARVRYVMNRPQIWFGVDRVSITRAVLDDTTWPELLKLINELCEHRRAGGDAAHALFRAAPEAWLESLLRRDVTRLDPGLAISPIYAQFRAGLATRGREVDLLALRNDGRLVVIELKTSEDNGLPFQAADYFRRVEIYRRAGAINAARLFGDRPVADLPPLLYAVAPGLRFARSFNSLARTLSPEIEIYRFDINEDWRAGVRVMRRVRAN